MRSPQVFDRRMKLGGIPERRTRVRIRSVATVREVSVVTHREGLRRTSRWMARR